MFWLISKYLKLFPEVIFLDFGGSMEYLIRYCWLQGGDGKLEGDSIAGQGHIQLASQSTFREGSQAKKKKTFDIQVNIHHIYIRLKKL